MVSPGQVKRLLEEFHIRPKKSLGQNFIVSEPLLQAIVEAAEVGKQDTILEIGAGLGALTNSLAERAGRVIALELDGRLIGPLRQILAHHNNVEIVQGDILEVDLALLLGEQREHPPFPFKVVGNLPYYATSAILRRLLEGSSPRPQLLVVTVQREVGERIVAKPGQMSLLAVSVQFYGQPRIVARAPPGAFYPSPKVSSAVVRVDLYREPPYEVEDPALFFSVVRAGFSQRRKYLRNSLPQGLGLPQSLIVAALRRAGVEETLRPQALSIDDWAMLYRELAPVLCNTAAQKSLT